MLAQPLTAIGHGRETMAKVRPPDVRRVAQVLEFELAVVGDKTFIASGNLAPGRLALGRQSDQLPGVVAPLGTFAQRRVAH